MTAKSTDAYSQSMSIGRRMRTSETALRHAPLHYLQRRLSRPRVPGVLLLSKICPP